VTRDIVRPARVPANVLGDALTAALGAAVLRAERSTRRGGIVRRTPS
jgi:hypothetical protein